MNPKILVIDDDPSMVQLMTDNLQDLGYFIISGYDGQAAIQMSKEEHPNLIIMDVNMPMTNGLRALEMIRQNAETQAIPIILLTGETSDRVFPMINAAGRVTHLKKPIDLEELNSLVKDILQRFPTK